MTRVRFAPAPTGFLHIGGARTFIFNWLYARKEGGQVVLRIDDTDVERSTGESLTSILEGLTWLELPWDEKHHQSDRRAMHAQAAEALLAKGAAYRDFTPQSEEPADGEAPSSAPWLCNPVMREMPREESDRRAAAGEGFVVRFRVPREAGGGVKFKDLVYRDQFRKIGDIEDFALLRSSGAPTYHLASTVDDAELKISHIIRGQDHLSNTYKHVLLFEALGVQAPRFGHLPLLLGPDGSKLSKRKHGPIVSVTTYRDRGFLPHAFVNYLSLLGWSPKDNREVLTLEELQQVFSLEGILRTNSVVTFDEASEENWADPKALWINSQHLRGMPVEKLLPYVQPMLQEAGCWKPEYEAEQKPWFTQTVDLLRARFGTLRDFQTRAVAYFGDRFDIEPQALKNLDKPEARELLRKLADRLEALPELSEENVEQQVRDFSAENNVKPGLIINASRAALTGQPVGPSAFAIFAVLGRERVLERLRSV
jgi:glutamyl-tRNA synthetase